MPPPDLARARHRRVPRPDPPPRSDPDHALPPRRCGRRAAQNRSKGAATALPAVRSRLAVGSSAKMIGGSNIRARAIATRCCSPRDSPVRLLRFPGTPRPFEQFIRPAAQFCRRQPVEPRRQHDVVAWAHFLDEMKILENKADVVAAPPVAAALAKITLLLSRRTGPSPGHRPDEAGQNIEQRRLARSRHAEDGGQLARHRRKIDGPRAP